MVNNVDYWQNERIESLCYKVMYAFKMEVRDVILRCLHSILEHLNSKKIGINTKIGADRKKLLQCYQNILRDIESKESIMLPSSPLDFNSDVSSVGLREVFIELLNVKQEIRNFLFSQYPALKVCGCSRYDYAFLEKLKQVYADTENVNLSIEYAKPAEAKPHFLNQSNPTFLKIKSIIRSTKVEYQFHEEFRFISCFLPLFIESVQHNDKCMVQEIIIHNSSANPDKIIDSEEFLIFAEKIKHHKLLSLSEVLQLFNDIGFMQLPCLLFPTVMRSEEEYMYACFGEIKPDDWDEYDEYVTFWDNVLELSLEDFKKLDTAKS